MKYRIKRIVTKKECHWLDNDIQEGATVYKFDGNTYGCISSSGTAVTFSMVRADNIDNSFFEIPRDALELIEGD